jgi:hypothetical protein
MKKTGLRQPIEAQNAPQYGFNKLRPLKIPAFAWYALIVSVVMAAALFVLYAMTFAGTKDPDKTLLIYSDGTTIPEVSLRNSLAAADFGYEIIEKEEKVGFFTKIGNGVKSGAKKVKTTMSEHPVATFITGTVVGAATTVATAVAVNKALNKDNNEDLEGTDISNDDLADVENVEDDTNVDI